MVIGPLNRTCDQFTGTVTNPGALEEQLRDERDELICCCQELRAEHAVLRACIVAIREISNTPLILE